MEDTDGTLAFRKYRSGTKFQLMSLANSRFNVEN